MPENLEILGQENSEEEVESALSVEQRSVREETTQNLLSLKELIPVNDTREAWEESLRGFHEESLVESLSLFRSENPKDRKQAAWMRPSSIPSHVRAEYEPILHDLMRDLVDDPDVRVRIEIAKSWFFKKYYPDLAPLINHHPSEEVRAACAGSFGFFTDWDEELIRDYLHDESPLVRAAMVKRWDPFMPFAKDVVALVYDDAPEVQLAVQDSEAVQYMLGYWSLPLLTPGLV